MADPTPYERDYSFTAWQSNRPDKPLPGSELDIELDNIATAAEATVEALKDIRRADGALKNEIVTADALSPGLADEITQGAITAAQGAAALAEAWAQSPTPPDPEDPDSKSAKTWAGEAAASEGAAETAAAQAALYDGPWFDDVAALLADTTLTYTAGTPSSVADGDYVRTRGEGFAYEVAASGATDQHVATAGGVKLYVLVVDGKLSGDAFGEPVGGSYSAVVQKAFDTASSLLTLSSPPSGTNSRPWVALSWSRKEYYCATPVTLPTHINVEMNGATFSAPSGGRIFDANPLAYRWKWTGPGVFWGDDVEAIVLDGNNLNNAWFHFSHIDISTQTRTVGKWGVNISSRSSRITFEECNARLCQFPFRTKSDFTFFKGGWWSGHVGTNPKPGGQGSAEFAGNDVHLDGVVCIPEPQGQTRQALARWIDKRCRKIEVNGSHFGSENGGCPIVYEFERKDVEDPPLDPLRSAVFDPAIRSMSDSVSFTGCNVSAGSSVRADAGVIVLQDGVLPGVYSFIDCEKLSAAPLISAHGWDQAGSAATQNAALRAALQAANAVYRANVQIIVDQPDLYNETISVSVPRIVPPCLRGYMVGPREHRTITQFLPASETDIPVLEIALPTAPVSGQRAWSQYKMRVALHRGVDLANMLYQEKTYRVIALHSSTSAMSVRLVVDEFFEHGRTVSQEQGDVIVSAVVDGTPTSTYARVAINLADLDPAEQYQSFQVSLLDETGGATNANILRRFAALYPIG